MKILKKVFVASLFTVVAFGNASAQENAGTVSYQDVEQLQADNAVAKKLKISGYVQMQYQKADTAGISSFAGGNFASGVDNRMLIRRGRVKFAYDNEGSQAVMQFDITEKGLGIKDAYVSVTDPLIKVFSLTGGVFDRPFGYEISYSSSTRETPERSRIFQTLFPGERDLGARLTIQAPKTSSWNFLRLELGLFNGNGIAVETDSYKDFIGHLSATKTSSNEKMVWGIGASMYKGGFAKTADKTYSINEVDGVKVFTASNNKIGDKSNRHYFGVDGQFSYDWALGITQVRAEYLTGTQPGLASSSSSLTAAASGNVFNRKFNGYYVYFIQNILQTPLQAVVKYDVYDPNTEVAGNEIGETATGALATNATDAKFSTLGLGLNYRFNSNVKIMAYYDIVANEKIANLAKPSTLTDLSRDRKDNVFTLRMQYKF
ncbi:MAG: porin [Bacteroidales bacterium]|nr:porin [Bacteroidales bacterium]